MAQDNLELEQETRTGTGMTCLSIWGHSLGFSGFSTRDLENLTAEFAGAVSPSAAPSHVFCKVGSLARPGTEPIVARRHGAGSYDTKSLLDGSPFDSKSQDRLVTIYDDGHELGLYDLDGVLCAVTATITRLSGGAVNTLPRHVLPDLVEAFLLGSAYQKGWVQLHAAGWLEDGKAVLVLGSSGAGKTTALMQALLNGSVLLGNDRLFIRQLPDGSLQARGYPLSINVGCGTIRALALPLPHGDKPDSHKVRLRPREVVDLFCHDYFDWHPLAQVTARDLGAVSENIYWDDDPTHPRWCLPYGARALLQRASIEPAILSLVSTGGRTQ